jgi:LysM repeat protein
MNRLLLSSILATGLALSGVSAVYAADQYGNSHDTMQETSSSHENPASANYGSEAREYTVKAGDTLASIAESELGSSDKWREIARANNIENPDHITVGEKLTIPASEEGSGSAMNEEAPQQQSQDTYTRQEQSDKASENQSMSEEQELKGEITEIGNDNQTFTIRDENGQRHSFSKFEEEDMLKGLSKGDFVKVAVEDGTVVSLEKVDRNA